MASPAEPTSQPPQKQHIAANIAMRGPLRSTQVPKIAAESPSTTMPMVNGRALSVPEMPSAPSNGFLNTLHEYAAPIDR